MNIPEIYPAEILLGGCAVAFGIGFLWVSYWYARVLLAAPLAWSQEPIGVLVVVMAVIIATVWVAVGVTAYQMVIGR